MRFESESCQDGVGVAETLLTVSPGCSNFTSVLNVANQPIQFAKGTVIGHIEELTPDTTVETLASYEEAQQASAGAYTAQSAASTICSSTKTAAVKASRAGSDPEPSAVHYPVRATVSDEQIQSLLMTGDEYSPLLDGLDDEGRPRRHVARSLLQEFKHIFAADPKNPNVTNKIVLDVDTGDAPPFRQAARRKSDTEEQFIKKSVKEMHERGLIRPSTSPWAANPVLVKQGTKVRFCVDYRDLNKVTRRDSHGLGNIDDMLQKLGGATFLSSLDLAAGYHQIRLTKEAAEKQPSE